MAKLRTPVFLVALLLIIVVVQVERSALSATAVAARLSALSIGARSLNLGKALDYFSPEQRDKLAQLQRDRADEIAKLDADLSGFGVEALQYVDVTLVFTLALMALSLLIPAYVQAKVQGVLTLIFAILLILAGLARIPVVIGKLTLMVALLLSFPFGTIAYLIIYGSFPRAAASAVLSLLFTLKLLFGIVLLVAHQRFIENKGLVLFFIVALIANVIVGFLHGFVPGFLVSITDSIAAIVVIIISIILAIILAIGGIISIILALKPS